MPRNQPPKNMPPPPAAHPGSRAPESNAFETEADGVLRSLQPALAAIVEHLRPAVMRPADLQKRLGLDKKLSWSVYNAATARDPRAVAAMLPGRRAMRRFFTAASLQGVPDNAIERANRAFDEFEASVARHAGSRDAFENMLAEHAPDPDAASTGHTGADLKHKRAAFRAASLLWGRQAKVGCGIQILHPGADSALLDTVLIKGLVGLRRTRRSVPLHTTAHHWRTPQPGDPANPRRREPLDPRATDPDGVWLLQDFCSRPLPEFRLSITREGYRSHELVSAGLGAADEITYFTGEGRRADTAPPRRGPSSDMWFSKAVDIPLEVLTQDILIHRSLWDTTPPEVHVYAYPLDGSLEFRDADLLPLSESAEYLGEGIDAARTPIVPRYADMIAYAMGRMGWNANEFRAFRCRVDYPVLYSRVRMTLC